MQVKVTKLDSGYNPYLTLGKVYDSYSDGYIQYLIDDDGDKMYFDLNARTFGWGTGMPFIFGHCVTLEEVKEESKEPEEGFSYNFRTSPEVMAEVLLKMADNISKGLRPKEGVQCRINMSFEDISNNTIFLDDDLEYRVKQNTITLKNGIEVPMPLERRELSAGGHYYFMPCASSQLCHGVTGYQGQRFNYALLYKTEEEAIEASKALFGLEIKDV